MYTTKELNAKKHAELLAICEKEGITIEGQLSKKQLVEKLIEAGLVFDEAQNNENSENAQAPQNPESTEKENGDQNENGDQKKDAPEGGDKIDAPEGGDQKDTAEDDKSKEPTSQSTAKPNNIKSILRSAIVKRTGVHTHASTLAEEIALRKRKQGIITGETRSVADIKREREAAALKH